MNMSRSFDYVSLSRPKLHYLSIDEVILLCTSSTNSRELGVGVQCAVNREAGTKIV
jgi:hypothetical protein